MTSTRVRAALAAALLSAAGLRCGGHRVGFLHSAELLGASAGDAEAASRAPPPPLRIFATTHNGGNKNEYSGEERRTFFEDLTRGHEDADIVLVGMQEFRQWDNFPSSKGKALWADSSAKLTNAIMNIYTEEQAMDGPAMEAHQRISDMFSAFHDGLHDRLELFRNEFASEKAQSFASSVSDGSPIVGMARASAAFISGALEKMRSIQNSTHQAKMDAIDGASFAKLRTAAAAWGSMATGFPSKDQVSSIEEDLNRIRAWQRAPYQGSGQVLDSFPNLKVVGNSEQSLGSVQAKIQQVDKVQGLLMREHAEKAGKFAAKIKDVQMHLEADLAEEEAVLMADVQQRWETIQSNLEYLENVLGKLGNETGFRDLVMKPPTQTLQKDLGLLGADQSSWKAGFSESLNTLKATVPLTLDPDEVRIPMAVQKHAAGMHCMWKGDTWLYAFINPWSKWKIEQEEAFAIGQDTGMECAKGVAVQVLRATHEQEKVRICGMSTHQSYAGTASSRMANLQQAMDRVGRSSCDVVVFVGDFNSRLHCTSGSGTVPAFNEGGKEKAFQTLMQKICPQRSGCSLAGSREASDADEMNGLLTAQALQCFEESDKTWKLQETQNTLLTSRLREVAPPGFAPTYKLSATKKALLLPASHVRCLPEDMDGKHCLVNEEKKAKNNPAWTDRILVSENERRVHLETLEYGRRTAYVMESDHAMVFARLEVSVKTTPGL